MLERAEQSPEKRQKRNLKRNLSEAKDWLGRLRQARKVD